MCMCNGPVEPEQTAVAEDVRVRGAHSARGFAMCRQRRRDIIDDSTEKREKESWREGKEEGGDMYKMRAWKVG